MATSKKIAKHSIYEDRLQKLICGFGYNKDSKKIVPKDVSAIIQDSLKVKNQLRINVIYTGSNLYNHQSVIPSLTMYDNTNPTNIGMAKFEIYLNQFVAKIISPFIHKYTIKFIKTKDESILSVIEDEDDETKSNHDLKIDETDINIHKISSKKIYGKGYEIYDQDGNGNCLGFLDIPITKSFENYLYQIVALDENNEAIFTSKWTTKLMKYWNHATIIKFNQSAVNTFFHHAIDINKNEFVTVNEWVSSLLKSYEFQKKTNLDVFGLERIYYLILSISRDDPDEKAGVTATDFSDFIGHKGFKEDYSRLIKYFVNHIPYFYDI